MADEKILKVGTTGLTEEFLPINSSAGAGDAGRVVRLDANGRWDITTMPTGVTANVVVCASFENLTAGDFVNLFLDTGVIKARKADASVAGAARRADGFVLANVTAPANATVYTDDTNTALAGLTIGGDVYLSTTVPGGAQQTVPTTAGHSLQRLGKATTATAVSVEIANPIVRA